MSKFIQAVRRTVEYQTGVKQPKLGKAGNLPGVRMSDQMSNHYNRVRKD